MVKSRWSTFGDSVCLARWRRTLFGPEAVRKVQVFRYHDLKKDTSWGTGLLSVGFGVPFVQALDYKLICWSSAGTVAALTVTYFSGAMTGHRLMNPHCLHVWDMGVSWNMGNPSHHPFIDGIFHHKPTILQIPHLWIPPHVYTFHQGLIMFSWMIVMAAQEMVDKHMSLWTERQLRCGARPQAVSHSAQWTTSSHLAGTPQLIASL